MKIGVNARLLAEPYTGIGRYTQHLFAKLADLHPDDQFTLVTYKKTDAKFPRNVKVVIIPEKKWLFSSSLKKGYWEKVQIRKFFNRGDFDIIHSTYPTPLRALKLPLVTTIHDVIPFKNRQYSRRLRTRIYLNAIRKAVPGQHFLAVSGTTRKEAIEYLKIPSAHIKTTYEAASETYLKESGSSDIPKPYLLYVGGYDSRKNVDYLCQVFSTIQGDFPDIKLVLAGGKLFESKLYDSHDLPKDFENSKINLLRTGFVEEEELNALYRGATALINLSKQEGFNLPILEAAYTGTPVITSDIEVHRELYSNHVLLLPLDDPESSSTQLKEFLENPTTQEKFRASTAELRAKYTWQAAAEKTHMAYSEWQIADSV